MPVQQTMSSFAKTLGGRVAAANAEHAQKPVDTGNRRLPAGIRDGIAKLSTMYTKEQDADNGMVPKGQVFFRASAVVVSPVEHNGERINGMITQILVPLCDVPAKGQRKATSFSENWYEFQNVFKLLGVAACPETPTTDPTGQRTEAYFMAAMKTLTDPLRVKTNPVYISFSTRGWTPPATPQQPKPTEMVFETWHGLADPSKVTAVDHHDPAAGMVVRQPHTSTQPDAGSMPPRPQAPTPNGVPSAVPNSVPSAGNLSDEVEMLVETAMGDPEGATEEGMAASARLEEMAWAAGWTKEHTANAADWGEVGGMVLNPPTPPSPAATAPPAPQPVASGAGAVPVTVGSRAFFAKRSKAGDKLKNSKGEPFPAQEVEVVTVDAAAKTCTVKSVKDSKDVVDIRSKQPIAVKWEWLEAAP